MLECAESFPLPLPSSVDELLLGAGAIVTDREWILPSV